MFLLFAVLVIFAFMRGAIACDDALCNHPDSGSCGNACCKVSFVLVESTVSVMNKLNQTITAGGPDGLYIPKMTAEGTLTFGDLRQYPGHPDFIGQAWHTTKNGLYNDTINLTLSPTDSTGESTRVLAFSTSQIAGAYGDDGQNYFNIVQLMQSIWTAEATQEDSSCPKAA